MKVKTSKGFTLAELLIVMAIITVLAAVAVPTFSKQVETSRESADLETLRNAYTDAFADAIQDVAVDGVLTTAAVEITGLTFIQTRAGFNYVSGTIGGTALPTGTIQGQTKATFTFALDADTGKLSCSKIETAA